MMRDTKIRVLAFDPGYDRLGAAVLERGEGGERLIFSSCITTDRGSDFPTRLRSLGNAVQEMIAAHNPDIVALERLYLTKNHKTAMAVAEVRGAILFLAAQVGSRIVEYTPQEVKVAVCGDGNGDKRQVMTMVPNLVKIEKEIKYDDEFDAIAIGLTALACHRGT